MKLRDPALTNKRIYYYCTAADERFASNAAVLIGAFMIIWEGKTAKEAYAPFAAVRAKFAPYRDASYWPSDFDVTVADTLDGIYKVRRLWLGSAHEHARQQQRARAIARTLTL
jgi:cell division cycle 14